MRCGILSVKKKKLWVIKAVDRGTRRTVDWVLGRRNTATFRRLYNKMKHLKHFIFYTDGWEVFEKVLPSKRHVSGKEHTGCIERDNSNTRHHLAVSHAEESGVEVRKNGRFIVKNLARRYHNRSISMPAKKSYLYLDEHSPKITTAATTQAAHEKTMAGFPLPLPDVKTLSGNGAGDGEVKAEPTMGMRSKTTKTLRLKPLLRISRLKSHQTSRANRASRVSQKRSPKMMSMFCLEESG